MREDGCWLLEYGNAKQRGGEVNAKFYYGKKTLIAQRSLCALRASAVNRLLTTDYRLRLLRNKHELVRTDTES
jgi:hypothetical protein